MAPTDDPAPVPALDLALACMEMLNLRAKVLRDRARRHRGRPRRGGDVVEIAAIYRAKADLVTELVLAGRSRVYRFLHHREAPRWGPRREVVETWYVVYTGPYRWHQPAPGAHPALARVAEPLPPEERHDPDQPATAVPPSGLTPAEQLACVRHAVAALRAARAADEVARERRGATA